MVLIHWLEIGSDLLTFPLLVFSIAFPFSYLSLFFFFKGHGKCVEYVKGFNVPMMLVGGGGYTIRNVSRCWCNETAIALDIKLEDGLRFFSPLKFLCFICFILFYTHTELPYNDYLEYFGPDYRLSIPTISTLQNSNSKEYLDTVLSTVLQNLKNVQGAPEMPVPKVIFSPFPFPFSQNYFL